MTNLLLSWDSGIEPAHACDCCKKYIYPKKRKTLEVRTCMFEEKDDGD